MSIGRWLFAVVLAAGATVAAQVPAPPPVGPGPGDLDAPAGAMQSSVRALAQDVRTEIGASAAGRHLIEDARELDVALGEFRGSLRSPAVGGPGRAFADSDASRHHLREGLLRPGTSTPAIVRAVTRVDETDGALHRALDVNVLPGDVYGGAAPATGPARIRQLAHAFVDRASALDAAVRAEMEAGPRGGPISDRTTRLVREADAWHDAIDINGRPEVIGRSFGPVATVADALERDLSSLQPQPPAGVMQAWRSFAAVESLVRKEFGMPVPPPTFGVPVATDPNAPPTTAVPADRLAAETEAFVQVFSRTAGITPEGGFFLADAQRLRDAALAFRDLSAQGADPGRLSFAFANVDAAYRRLGRRTARIARGRTGPNIQQVQKIGAIVNDLHQALGMPGYVTVPTVVAP